MFIIRPRKIEATSHYDMKVMFLPWWIKTPYKVTRFLYEYGKHAMHADIFGASKVLLPIGIYFFIEHVQELHTKSLFSIGNILYLITVILTAITVIINMSLGSKERLKKWQVRKWIDYDSQYHKE